MSVKPGTLSKHQEEELKTAFRRAAQKQPRAIPVDWMETLCPRIWRTEGIEENYSWDEDET